MAKVKIVRAGRLTEQGMALLKQEAVLQALGDGEHDLVESTVEVATFQGKKDKKPRIHVLSKTQVGDATIALRG